MEERGCGGEGWGIVTERSGGDEQLMLSLGGGEQRRGEREMTEDNERDSVAVISLSFIVPRKEKKSL